MARLYGGNDEMTASELIKELQELINDVGDLDVKIHNPYGESYEDDFETINIEHVEVDDYEDAELDANYICLEGF